MDIKTLRSSLSGFSMFSDVDALPKGHLRIETLLKYPDGTSIEVFLKSPAINSGGNAVGTLSDLGQTTAWLMTAQVRPWISKKRQALLDEIVQSSGVSLAGGALELNTSNIGDLPLAVLRLAQCCSRVADLTFTKRTALQTLAKEEIEEFLVDLDASFEADVSIPCKGRDVRVDFMVTTPSRSSAILTLSSMNTNSAHTMANELFTKWYDIEKTGRTEQRITVFDDRLNVYRDDDLERLQELSAVVPFSDRQSLKELVAA
jgi:hypothetical protein